MIFQETYKQVLAGTKYKTRRIMKPGDFLSGGVVFNKNKHVRYATNSKHALQTGRTSAGLWWLPGIINTAVMPVVRYPTFDGVDTVDYHNLTRIDQRQELKERGYLPVRLHITGIEPDYNVREIAWSEAVAEGFSSVMSFSRTWVELHDKPMLKHWDDDGVSADYWFAQMYHRPAHKYQAWCLTFCLVDNTPPGSE